MEGGGGCYHAMSSFLEADFVILGLSPFTSYSYLLPPPKKKNSKLDYSMVIALGGAVKRNLIPGPPVDPCSRHTDPQFYVSSSENIVKMTPAVD